MSRLPIRIRLTLPFAVVMAAVLAAMGIVLYLRVGSALLTSVDQNLDAQIAEATSHASEGRRQLLDRDVSDGPTVAQAQLLDGTVVESSPAGLRPIVPESIRAAVDRRPPRPHDHHSRRAPRRLANDRRAGARCAAEPASS